MLAKKIGVFRIMKNARSLADLTLCCLFHGEILQAVIGHLQPKSGNTPALTVILACAALNCIAKSASQPGASPGLTRLFQEHTDDI